MKKQLFVIFCLLVNITLRAQVPVLIKNTTGDWANAYPDEFTAAGGKTFFTAFDPTGHSMFALWITDGTAAGTQIISPSDFWRPTNLVAFKDKVYFQAGTAGGPALCVSDGTSAGTKIVKHFYFEDGTKYYSSPFCVFKDNLYFWATDGINGVELWATDGTTAGTHLLKDINPGSGSSNPQSFTIYKDKFYFQANDGINGTELWSSDGSKKGTMMVKNISGAGSSEPSNFTICNDKLFFVAFEAVHGVEIWVTDGTDTGTHILKDINTIGAAGGYSLAKYNNKLIIKADDNIHGTELWISDGTEAGTYFLKDINPLGSSDPFDFKEYNGLLYFWANDSMHGTELWRSDGTDTGTYLFKDINLHPMKGGGIVADYTNHILASAVFNNKLYFIANDTDINVQPFNYNLWVTNGDPDSTYIVTPAGPIPQSPLWAAVVMSLHPLYVCNESLYYMAKYSDSIGAEPYRLSITPPLAVSITPREAPLMIYPNPAHTAITLKCASDIDEVQFFDLNGCLSFSQVIGAREATIPLAPLAAGLYLVQVRSGAQIINSRLLVQH